MLAQLILSVAAWSPACHTPECAFWWHAPADLSEAAAATLPVGEAAAMLPSAELVHKTDSQSCDASAFKLDLGKTRCPAMKLHAGVGSAAECQKACCDAGVDACTEWQWCEPGKPCGDGFWAESGAFWAGSDLDGWPQVTSIGAAEAACSASAECVGLTFHSAELQPKSPLKIYLKKAGSGFDNDPSWSRHIRAASGCYLGSYEEVQHECANASDGWSAKAMGPMVDYFYTHFHAQPLKNWLNDPNGPMFFHGMYHLFFQYNPESKQWGDMHWYHLTSTDLLHWKHQPVALAPDKPYDCGGIFSGSATVVHNATTGLDVPVLTYSVACGKAIVNAFPADPTDPLLVNWTKPDYNPIIPIPANVSGGFRDPTTAWQGADKVWRLLVGCGDGEGTCQFKSVDFISWSYVGAFHSHGGGMWECPDFYRIPNTDAWVLKASTGGRDWWSVGKYTEVAGMGAADSFAPYPGQDIGEAQQQYDFGSFYASKVFIDTPNSRAVLFGWVRYTCPRTDWTGIQTFPRVVGLDPANASRITTNPLPELASLYDGAPASSTVTIKPGESAVVANGTQLDLALGVGPVGATALVVRAFASADGKSGKDVSFGAGVAAGVVAGTLNGAPFPVAKGDAKLQLRLLIDHSVVEAYAQGGRAVATLPFCPLSASDDGVIITNNGDADVVVDVTASRVATANVIPAGAAQAAAAASVRLA